MALFPHNSAFSQVTALATQRAVHAAFAWLHGNPKTIMAVCVEDKAPDDLVFTRPDGSPPGDFRKAWSAACERAECPGLLFHDLLRTWARNMQRLCIAENVIMRIGGWKTVSVFRRYDIVDQSDLADASRRIDDRQKELATEFGASLGKVGAQDGAKESRTVQ
jgi:integrase